MKKSLTFLLLCASIAVAGCGSGSGGGSILVPSATPSPSPTATPSPAPTATPIPTSILLNGSAFQGAIITNETIIAYSVDPTDGANIAFLGATTADNTGNFNLTISPVPTGPIRVISDSGNLQSAMDGSTIPAPGDLAALFLSATASIANISINPLSDFVDSLTIGNLRTPGTTFTTAFNSAVAKIEADYGLKTGPAQITPDYTAATVGTDAGNLGLILAAMINEDQFLCPGAAGGLVNALSSDIGDGAFDGLSFGTPISYCGSLLFSAAGLSFFQDALSGLSQFQEVTKAFAFGTTGNLLTRNGLANVSLNGTEVYPLAPLAAINTAVGNAAPIPQNSFAPPAQTATMNTARGFASATLLPTGQVLIAGGQGLSGPLASVELYDPVSNSFAPPPATPLMNTPRQGATATLLSTGFVLIAGGFGGTPTSTYRASTELYEISNNSFLPVTNSMNVARSSATAILLANGKVLIAGGINSTSGGLACTELYNAATNAFAPSASTATMNSGRSNTVAVLLPNGKVLIAGGSDAKGTTLASTELYNPATNTFAAPAATANMNVARQNATATLLPNGKVLIAGGLGSAGINLGGTELYDSATNTFARPPATVPMNNARAFAVASLLPSGRVLIASGFDVNFNLTTSTELYNPVTNSFAHATATASMNMGRTFETIAPLPNGKVLIAGGSDPIDSSTDLYTP